MHLDLIYVMNMPVKASSEVQIALTARKGYTQAVEQGQGNYTEA